MLSVCLTQSLSIQTLQPFFASTRALPIPCPRSPLSTHQQSPRITPSIHHTHAPGHLPCEFSTPPSSQRPLPTARAGASHQDLPPGRVRETGPADWTAGLVTLGVQRRSAIVLSRPRWDGGDGLNRREVQRAQDGAQTQISLDRPPRK